MILQRRITILQALLIGLGTFGITSVLWLLYFKHTEPPGVSLNRTSAVLEINKSQVTENREAVLSREPCDVVSAFNTSFVSPLTSTLDGRFYCTALRTGTDKIFAHHYQYIYSLYFQRVHQHTLKILEVGLGCDTHWGAGKSLQLWKELIPNAVVSFLEHNTSCALNFQPTVEGAGGRMYIGGQEEPTLLQQVVDDAQATASLYDAIIDDGGHRPDHQLVTLQHLWPVLKSGGVFVVEDVMTHYLTPYQEWTRNPFIPWIKKMMDIVHCNTFSRDIKSWMMQDFKELCANATQMEREVMSIECMVDACVLVKAVPPRRSQMEEMGEWVEKREGWPV